VPVAPPVFSWAAAKDFDPPKWERSIEPIDERGQTVLDPNSVRSFTAFHHPTTPVYSRNNMQWEPGLEVFGLPENEVQYLDKHKIYNIEKGIEQPKEIASTYPFANKPEFEIPDFLPSPASLPSCSGDTASLDERLRAYASNVIPEAKDRSLRFEGNVTPSSEYVAIASEDGCGTEPTSTSGVPPCTKTTSDSREVTCGAPVYLGTFVSPAKPEQCKTPAAACYSNTTAPSGPQESEQPTHIRVLIAKAKEVGFSEITTALPGSQLDCANAGCAEFIIDTLDQRETRIVGRYHMPLSFPLDAILGRSSIAVEKTKQELQELAIAGRANAGAPN
jgi:hypothetical protein